MRVLVLLLGLHAAAFALSPEEGAKVKEAAREYIKDHLKAPATAVFSKETLCATSGAADFEEAKGTGPTPECKPQTASALSEKDAAVVYRGSVDAQNSFGALIRTKFQLQISSKGGKIQIFDPAEGVKLLKDSCETSNEAKKALGQRPSRDCSAEFPNAK